MTTDVGDALASIVAIGSGRLVSPESHRQMLAPTTAGFPGMSAETYYALGVVVTNGWVAQTPYFGGYSATVAYLPDRRLGRSEEHQSELPSLMSLSYDVFC